MYTEFFGLSEKPFSITPDPRYLFMSERHGEGLAHLVYGVRESSGFIQLTGEVGTGKTTLVRTLLNRMPEGVDIALILNPQLTPVEFLAAICEELKIDLPGQRDSTKALVDTLNSHLLKSHAADRRTILLIDEAQNLATEVLEQVRLLTNLETSRQKLLQIILIAQPELRDKLSQSNLRQLAQRITGRYHLEPLTREETIAYIDHRMKVAGAVSEIFDAKAKREIHRLSGGVPRLVNVIADRALLGAYSLGQRRVTTKTVRQAAREVSGDGRAASGARLWIPAVGLLAAVATIAVWWAINGQRMPTAAAPATDGNSALAAAASESLAGESTPALPDAEAAAVDDPPSGPTLDEVLQDPASRTDAEASMTNLLAAWGVSYRPGGGDACSQAAAAGLSCLNQRGSWQILEQLDRPAVLSLTDSTGRMHQVLVAAVEGDRALLRIGDRSLTVPVAEVASLWYGRYVLLWQPPNGDATVLRVGIRSPKVVWLRESLAALDADAGTQSTGGSQSDLFDEALEQQLMAFQRRNRLEVDGIAGQRTQIIINSKLRLEGTPSLTGG